MKSSLIWWCWSAACLMVLCNWSAAVLVVLCNWTAALALVVCNHCFQVGFGRLCEWNGTLQERLTNGLPLGQFFFFLDLSSIL